MLKIFDNEFYAYKDITIQPDRNYFIQAMEKEVDAHERRDHWKMCKRSDFPKVMKPITSKWSFKSKQLPTRELLKHKARLCAHGG